MTFSRVAKDVLALVGAASLGGLVVAAMLGAVRPAPGRVEAKELVIVDDGGKVLARLRGEAKGPQFTLYDADGKPGVTMAVLGGGNSAVVVGELRGRGVTIAATETGPKIRLDGQDAGEVYAGVDEGGVNVRVMDGDNRALFEAVKSGR